MPEITASRYLVQAGWDDVPHLDDKTKRELMASTMPHLRDARSKGTPSLGAGAIYPVPESDFVVDPFQIPAFWPRSFGMDVGWNRTAVIWGAMDRSCDCVHLYTEHYRGLAEPPTHVAAIKARGDWIPGAIDPAAHGRSQKDGEELFKLYVELGLNITKAVNAVEAGLYEVWYRMVTGRLKVFRTCTNWLAEFRLYRRDEHGAIVKKNDHLMDATRYLAMTGLALAIVQPARLAPGTGAAMIGDQSAGY
jgi:hypothetical protein